MHEHTDVLHQHICCWCAAAACRIVSATDLRKYDDPPGLQDNAEIALNFLAGDRTKRHSSKQQQQQQQKTQRTVQLLDTCRGATTP
jgi:hypothetical protein